MYLASCMRRTLPQKGILLSHKDTKYWEAFKNKIWNHHRK